VKNTHQRVEERVVKGCLIAEAWLRPEPDPTFGPKRDRRKGLGLLVLRFEGEMLHDGREDQYRLHHGEAIADANAGTTTEGHVGEAR